MLINKSKIVWYGMAALAALILLLNFGFCGCSPVRDNLIAMERIDNTIVITRCDELATLIEKDANQRCKQSLEADPNLLACRALLLRYKCPSDNSIDVDIQLLMKGYNISNHIQCGEGIVEGIFNIVDGQAFPSDNKKLL